jgi:CRISPR-associated protein Cmr4
MASYKKFQQIGIGLDPIHVGTGGAGIGRVDMAIVRDPVSRMPKIPGSSLAGVYRTYVAMAQQETNPNRQVAGKLKPYYPDCAGLGQSREDGTGGHCGQSDCPICTVFGFAKAKDQAGGFAGLGAFSDAHVLLFPVPTRQGPHWVTSPMMLRHVELDVTGVDADAVFMKEDSKNKLNMGWLLLDVKECSQFESIKERLKVLKLPDYILNSMAILPDRLFIHVVNSNLEVRTSVSIKPETGAAEEQALFSYEALPRGTVLYWEIIAKNPNHFQVNGKSISAVNTPDSVHNQVETAHSYIEHLGIGGMGTRGMGRLRVLHSDGPPFGKVNIKCDQAGAGQNMESQEKEAGHGY